MSIVTENAIIKMEESNLDETGSHDNKYTLVAGSLRDNNETEQKVLHLESAVKTECIGLTSKSVNMLLSEELLPVRLTDGSQYYTAAYRLDETNVCAEAVEAILFDSLDGECILAEYQQNNCLSSTTQQKLTDLLLTRSAKSLIGAKHIQNYFVKLTDSIIRLMPNEDPNVYYIPPQSSGNESKNPKGKLPDKWRNLTYQLRMRGILPKRKGKDKRVNASECSSSSTAQSVRAAVDAHMRSLQMLEASLSQLIVHWDATIEYRKLIRSSLNNLNDILFEWPILRTDKGPHLIDYEFKHLYGEDDVTNKWTIFFNALYDVKKSSVRDSVGKEYCNMYEHFSNTRSETIAGIQIQLLPFLITPTTKFKTGSGITVKPSMLESSEGFVIYCKTAEALADKILSRSDRYGKWHMPVHPCIVFRGPQPCIIETAYVSLQEQLWKVDTPLRALDLAFKLYQVFNLHYPPDCEQVWLVVQKMVFDITKVSDKKINNVTSLINVLNVKLQNKRPRTE
ncbi:uncharacterized protein LOC131666503 [Phymastichus coffea]|uniref:uncharacterized protein LOC131666503 n=1 Tax=Phymastichus coffea TaxID=108790 RepID=UPI00273AD916|nr:uncharacterized protein LOC131666503 [Phymastichus coffea]